jgi:hypothetical protein
MCRAGCKESESLRAIGGAANACGRQHAPLSGGVHPVGQILSGQNYKLMGLKPAHNLVKRRARGYFVSYNTRQETICPGTSKLACWRVQLSTASKVGRRGAGTATASIEASLLAGDISDPPTSYVDRQH